MILPILRVEHSEAPRHRLNRKPVLAQAGVTLLEANG
jgi:hypothetical protein